MVDNAPYFTDQLYTRWSPDSKGESDAVLTRSLTLITTNGDVFTVPRGSSGRASIKWYLRPFVSPDHYRRAWFVHDEALRDNRIDHIYLIEQALIADNCPPKRRKMIVAGIAKWDLFRTFKYLISKI